MIPLPSIDLASMMDNYSDIFSEFEYPKMYSVDADHVVTERNMTEQEKEDLIDTILMETEGLEASYTDPDILKNRIGIYSRRRVRVWNNYSRGVAFNTSFDPTENVFEKTRSVRAIAVKGADTNTESRDLSTNTREDRALTSADTEVRDLSKSATETRDLTSANSEVKGYGERNSETFGSVEGRAKSTDLSDVTDEITAKATANTTTRDLTDTTSDNESNSESTVHDLSNLRDVTVEESQNASSDVRTLNTADSTTERKTISEQTELTFTNRQDKTDVKNNQTQTVDNTHDVKKTTTDSEATINSENGLGNSSANVAVTQSDTAGYGTASGVSLPIDNAQTRTHKTTEEYDANHNTDTTTTSYTRSGSDGDVTTTDKLGTETTTKRYGVGQVDPQDSSNTTHTGTDSSAKTDAGSKTTTATHSGSEDTTINGAKASVGTATHQGTEDVTGNESGSTKSTAAHTGTENENVNTSSSKSFTRDGNDTTASTSTESGSVGTVGTDSGSVVRSASEGGNVTTTGTETGSISSVGSRSEDTDDTNDIYRHGNIGVTKSSELIMDYQNMIIQNELFNFVMNDIKHRFCLEVY